MMTVQIVCVGKLKEAYWRDACNEYAKRLSAFCKFRIVECDEAKVPENASPAQIEDALRQEGERILSHIPGGGRLIALCIEGRPQSSEALAAHIGSLGVSGVSHVSFVIGGSWGLSPAVKKRSDLRLSMSPMTFPHQLARVMLCEQIYRAFQIHTGGKYHK